MKSKAIEGKPEEDPSEFKANSRSQSPSQTESRTGKLKVPEKDLENLQISIDNNKIYSPPCDSNRIHETNNESVVASPARRPKNVLYRMFSYHSKSESREDTTSKPGTGQAATSDSGNSNAKSKHDQSINAHTMADFPPPTTVSGSEKSGSINASRFTVHADGTHTHYMRPFRRQEKLRNMLRDIIGSNRSKKEEPPVKYENNTSADKESCQLAVSSSSSDARSSNEASIPIETSKRPHRLSLVQEFVNKVKNEAPEPLNQLRNNSLNPQATYKQISNPNLSLVQKYGKCQEIVGRGAFGIVRISHKYDSKQSKKEQLFAVKAFKRRNEEPQRQYTKRLTSEFCISSSLQHPNIIRTLDLIQDAKGEYCEVMEYCNGGDLYSLILTAGKLEPLEADCFFKQLMCGVAYMHDMGVSHRDLKPENLILTSNGALKITDFGNGECFRMAWESEAHLTNGICGSAPYIAPEEYTDSEFDPRAVDVWACGLIYMAMRTGRHLWHTAREDDEYYHNFEIQRKKREGYDPIEALKGSMRRIVLYSILEPKPKSRISARQILKNEWVRKIYVCVPGELGG